MFAGAITQDMKNFNKPALARKLDVIILHTGTDDLKSNKNPSDITNEILELAKNTKSNGIEVVVSSWRYLKKGKRVKNNLQERWT